MTTGHSPDTEKILLALLPFWTPLMPPLGLACLKSFLHQHGYHVITVDANVEERLYAAHYAYIRTLQTSIPQHRQGNIQNIGNEVFQHHLMACLYDEHRHDTYNIVSLLVKNTFFCDIAPQAIEELNKIIADFYRQLHEFFLDLLQREHPTIVGLSVFTGTLPASLYVFKLVKQYDPDIVTMMGGGIFADMLAPESSDFTEFLKKTSAFIDAYIVGEGENPFLAFLRGELPPSQRVYTLDDIQGRMLDLASAPLPDFSDFQLRCYPHLAHYTSRSCPFQCAFCSETVQWGIYRKKPAEHIVAELLRLSQRYRSQLFLLGDSLLNPVITDVARACAQAESVVYWDGYLRVGPETCIPENALLWRRGGFYRARLGIESGSPHVLELMDKRISVQQIRDTLRNFAEVGIKVTTYWVVGYPGETEEDFGLTLELITELKDAIYEAECNPFHYFPTGQVRSEGWAAHSQTALYPERVRERLLVQTYDLACEPSRAERYRRVVRFVEHCRQIGIPNPYSLRDIYQADRRWKNLHARAVPAFVEFQKGYVDECRHVI